MAEEIFYFCKQGGEISGKKKVEESTTAGIHDKAPDIQSFQALTGEGGVLQAGALPEIAQVSEAGWKLIQESIHGSTAKPKPQPRKPKEEVAEEVKPATAKEQALSSMADILKSATEARKYALALKHLNYAGELTTTLMNFSKKMETIYEKIQTHKDVEDESKFKKLNAMITEQQNWYKQAEAGCLANNDNKTWV